MRTHDGPDKPPRRARLADVAKLAGVSQQTVSNVVNERSGYTEMTRRRVLAATQELDFRPNISARSLRTRRTMRLGYYLSEDELDFRNPIGITFLRDLVVAAEERGYQIDVFTARRDDPDTFREVVARRAVDGFVLSHSSVVDPHPRLIADLGIPFAAMGGPHPTYHRAGSTSTTSPLIDYLVGEGHRRFGYVGEAGDRYWIVERLDGVRARLARHSLRLPDSAIVAGPPEEIGPVLRRMLGQEPRPSVLVGGTDRAAAAAYHAATAMGLTVGRDMAITTIDVGGPVPWSIPIPRTALRIPIADITEALVARVALEIDRGPTGEPGTIIQTSLVSGFTA
jgi:DNA-binding LacI/PurR family transcriptional regulator